MKTSIDTVLKALDLALEYVGTEGGMMTRQEAKLQIALKQAIAALPTIDYSMMVLAEKLRQYLPYCCKQDMTNHDKEMIEFVDSILDRDC